MSVETDTIVIDRQISLLEAFLFALATHAAILVVLSLLGLLGLLTERSEPIAERDTEVRFTVAPEPEPEPLPDSSQAAPAGVPEPAEPTPFPPEDGTPPTQPENAEPDPQAPATLDQPQALIVPVPPSEQTQPEADFPNPTERPQTEIGKSSSEGVSDGTAQAPELDSEQPAEVLDLIDPGQEPAADATASPESGTDTELDLPQTDEGDFAPLERAVPERGARQPDGPSMVDRLTDFSRAVQRAREAAPPQPRQAPRNTFEPDWSNLPATGQALGDFHFESGAEYNFEDYHRQIYWIIWRTWHNRLLARVDDFEKWAQQNRNGYMEHINQVRFTIQRNGEITDIVVESESDSTPFDLSAVEGLDEAVLPPLPDDFHKDAETVHARFIAQRDIGSLRRDLQRLKLMGWF